jgi:uridine kinase
VRRGTPNPEPFPICPKAPESRPLSHISKFTSQQVFTSRKLKPSVSCLRTEKFVLYYHPRRLLRAIKTTLEHVWSTKLTRVLIVIHQDNYFFLDKSQNPLRTFGSTKDDEPFIESALDPEFYGPCLYTICWKDGGQTRTVGPIVGPGQREPDHTEMENKVKKAWDIELKEYEMTLNDKYRITGPDADCNESVNFDALLEAVNTVVSGGAPPSTGLSQSHVNIDTIVEQHSKLIARMAEKVTIWTKAQAVLNAEARFSGHLISSPIENASKNKEAKASIRPALCFIEGFLLFSNGPGDDETLSKKANLMPLFDIKLFLSATKDAVKKRRFSRPVYTDQPKGQRLAGQMWKTEGYFDQIVWGHFEEEHAWMFTNDGTKKQGIHFQKEKDASIEETVEWAVDAILAQMERECAGKRAEKGRKVGVKDPVVSESRCLA